jgi:hypothetical protein
MATTWCVASKSSNRNAPLDRSAPYGVSGAFGRGTNTLDPTGNGSGVTATFDGSSFSNFSTLGFEDGNGYDVTVINGFGGH